MERKVVQTPVQREEQRFVAESSVGYSLVRIHVCIVCRPQAACVRAEKRETKKMAREEKAMTAREEKREAKEMAREGKAMTAMKAHAINKAATN